MKQATFGAGCFWGVETEFRRVPGVIGTVVGYSGGQLANPSYEDVCTDRTGHAEVVQVTYDADRVSYEQLLEVFWTSHDPTQLDRQGPDVGRQYRSVIFYHDDLQRAEAEESKETLPITGAVPPPDRYPDRAGHAVLSRRGLPSAVSRKTRTR